jgi:3-hydroxyacyl-CoA dehydrogenase
VLRNSEGAQGQFVWAILRNAFHYAAVHLESIAESARDIDFAMRWGFGMKQGPFELWQEAGWLTVATMGAGRHRRGQSPVQCPAARLGVRRSGG